jgi:hypothetical protein
MLIIVHIHVHVMQGRLSYATSARLSGSPLQMGQEESFWSGGPHIKEITKLTPTPLDASSKRRINPKGPKNTFECFYDCTYKLHNWV